MWPKDITEWVENRTLYISIPFTWKLPRARLLATQKSFLYDQVIAGGPAVELIPDYLKNISNLEIQHSMPNVLQRVNPLATRTTLGCPKRCGFCGVGQRLIDTAKSTSFGSTKTARRMIYTLFGGKNETASDKTTFCKL